jgi:hypothetical protein
MVKKLQNKILFCKNLLTCNNLARKSGKGQLSYCKIGAESEGFNRRGSLVRDKM